MTDDERAQHLANYVSTIAAQMELQDWTITTDITRLDDNNIARCGCTYGRKRARIEIDPELLQREAAEVRQTIVHELVHIHLWGMSETVEDDLRALLHRDAYTALVDGFTRHLEYATDALADALAPRYRTFPEFLLAQGIKDVA